MTGAMFRSGGVCLSRLTQLQCRRSTLSTRWRRFTSQMEGKPATIPEEPPKSWRENPNVKYWVIGISALTGIIYCYVYKEKEKHRLVVKNYPPLPNHKLQLRHIELDELTKLHSSLKSGGVVTIHLEGPSGAGKTQLARGFAEKLALEEEGKYYFLPHNLFIGTINGSSLDSILFDMKKFAIAIGCQSNDWLDKIAEGTQFISLSSNEQLQAIVEAVKDKLKANPNWILVVENIQDRVLFDELFAKDNGGLWGKGTILVTETEPGVDRNAVMNNVYHMDKGLTEDDARQLLEDVSGLPADQFTGADQLTNKLCRNPLAVAYTGNYISLKAKQNPDYSIEDFSKELDNALNTLEGSNGSEVKQRLIYVVAALLAKELITTSPHFLHTFDLIGTCSPEWPIPVALISLHLKAPEFGLPEVPRSGPVIHVKSAEQASGDAEPEADVQEMFFSIKRLAHNLESFTTAVKENYKAIKEMFYPPPFDMAPQGDGVLDLMKTCPLVTVNRIDPGGTQTVMVNPIVHSVMSQLFQSITAPLMEEQHLVQAQHNHNSSSFFRRLWQFDPQRTLQEYRNALREGKEGTEQDPTVNLALPPVVFSTDVSRVFNVGEEESHLPEYRHIAPSTAARHYQQHTSRVLETLSRTASICSQDVQTRTLARLLQPHLDHILTENTTESLGNTSRAHALTAVASINSATGNLQATIPSLERALEIEEQHFGESSLEVAATLARLAEVYSSLDDAAKARDLLERAYAIYNLQRKKSGEYKKPLEFARTLDALGAVYGTLGFKQQSKEYIERALSYMQAAAPTNPDEIEGRRFSCEVASTLTDLGHAYLSAGDAFQGRKLLDLAVTGLKNMYGEEHPEVVRAMTVLSVAYTMQGNWQEGKKIRREAGKLQAKLDAAVPI